MQSFINGITTDHETTTQRLNEVMERLKKLKEERESSRKELRRHLDEKILQAINVLASYLKCPQVIERFCKWNTDELPDIEGPWEVTESAIHKLVQKRLQAVIEEWEGEQQHFTEARKSVVTFFLKKYNYLEKELQNLEVNVSQIQVSAHLAHRMHSTCGYQLQFGSQIARAIILFPPVLFGLALAVPVALLVLPALGVKFLVESLTERKKKNAYRENPSDFVREVSRNYLKDVVAFKAMKPLVEDQLAQALICLDELEAKIPRLIAADMKLCEHLKGESRSKKDAEALYKPHKEKCERLRGELGLFACLEILSMLIAWDDLEWDVSEDVYLKRSLPPGIYQGRISKGKRERQQVTLKVYKELLISSNVTDCLASVANMR